MTALTIQHRTVLAATAPFSLACALRAMGGFAPCGGDQSIHDGRVRKAFPRPGRPAEAVVVEVGPHPGDGPGVALTVFAAEALAPPEAAGIERAAGRWLSLGDDRARFLTLARADPALAPVLAVA